MTVVLALVVGEAAAADTGPNGGCDHQTSLRIVIVTCPPHNVKADGVTDDIAALQAIIDAQVGLANDAKHEIVLPCGTYLIGKPIRSRRIGYDCASTHAPVSGHVSTSLATGSGHALALSSARWLNLRDSPTLNLNGVGAFTVEFFYKQRAADTGPCLRDRHVPRPAVSRAAESERRSQADSGHDGAGRRNDVSRS